MKDKGTINLGLILAAAALLAVLFMLTACQPAVTAQPTPEGKAGEKAGEATAPAQPPAGGAPQAAPASTETKPKGILRFGVKTFGLEKMDPSQNAIIMSGIGAPYETYLRYAPDGRQEPMLLATQPKLSDDGLTWTFTLRQGIRFHDGNEMTAEDAKFSWDRFSSQESKTAAAERFRNTIDRIDVVDRYTFTIHTKVPWPTLPVFLGEHISSEGVVMPKDYIQRVGWAGFEKQPVGTGPWQFVALRLQEVAEFRAVQNHWRITPAFETLRLFALPEEATRVAMLKRGDLDLAVIAPDSRAELLRAGFTMLEVKDAVHWRIQFYGQPSSYRKNPMQDVRVRQALSIAIDRQSLLKPLFAGAGEVADIPAAPQGFGYPKLSVYPYDPQKAKELLREAGYPTGLDITLYSTDVGGVCTMAEAQRFAEATAAYWEAIGVRTRISPIEYNVLRQMYVPKQDDRIVGQASTFCAGGFNTFAKLSLFYWSKGLLKMTDIADDQVEKAIGARTEDEARRATDVAWRLIHDNYVAAPVANGPSMYAVSPKIDMRPELWLSPGVRVVDTYGASYAVPKP